MCHIQWWPWCISINVGFRILSSKFVNEKFSVSLCHRWLFHQYHLILRYNMLFSTWKFATWISFWEAELWLKYLTGLKAAFLKTEWWETWHHGTMAFFSRWDWVIKKDDFKRMTGWRRSTERRKGTSERQGEGKREGGNSLSLSQEPGWILALEFWNTLGSLQVNFPLLSVKTTKSCFLLLATEDF